MIFDNNCREVMNNQGVIVDRTGEFSAALIRNKIEENKNDN